MSVDVYYLSLTDIFFFLYMLIALNKNFNIRRHAAAVRFIILKEKSEMRNDLQSYILS